MTAFSPHNALGGLQMSEHENRQLVEQAYANFKQAIDSILDQRWPLLPTGRQLAAIAGTQTDIAINIEAERRLLRAVWRLQRHANPF